MSGHVDVDVHEALPNGPLDLVPYVDEPVRSWFFNGPLTTPHSHYLSPISPVLEELRAEEAAVGPKALLRLKAPTAAVTVEQLAAGLLDRYEPRFAVLTGSFHPSSFNLQPEGAVALARAYNTWLVEEWLERDRRLLGSIHVAVHDVAAAVAEIERCAEHPGMAQVMLPLLGWRWAQPVYAPIFEAIERRGLRAAMHPVGGATSPAMGDPPTLVEWLSTIQQNHMTQLTSLIFYGVFTRHPGLRVAFLESGVDWLPSMLSRLDYNWQSFRTEVPWVTRPPSEIVRERCVFTTHPFDVPTPEALAGVVELLGGDELFVYASNYPRFDFDSPDDAVLPARVMHDNAARFYDL